MGGRRGGEGAALALRLTLPAAANCLARRRSSYAFVTLKEVALEMRRMGLRRPHAHLSRVRELLSSTPSVVDSAERAWRLVRELVSERVSGGRRRRRYVFVYVRAETG